jgi:hypothetical protein
MVFALALLFSLSLSLPQSFAQTAAPAASDQAVLGNSNSILQSLSNLNQPACPLPASTASAPTEGVLVCTPSTTTPPASTRRAMFRLTSPSQVPHQVADYLHLGPSELAAVTPQTPLWVSVSLWNDNPLYNSKLGNDYGATGRTTVEVGWVSPKGITFGVYGSTGLFSERVMQYRDKVTGKDTFVPFIGYKETKGPAGSALVKKDGNQNQQFNEDELISFFVNNKEKGETFIWDANLGFDAEQSNKVLPYGESGLQKDLHGLTKITQLHNVPDQKASEYGAFLKGMVGLQNQIFDNATCSLHILGEGGGSFDTTGRRTYLLQDAQADFTIKKQNWLPVSIIISGGANAQQGPVSMAALNTGVAIKFHRFTIENSVSFLAAGKGFSQGFTPNPGRIDRDNLYKLRIIVR